MPRVSPGAWQTIYDSVYLAFDRAFRYAKRINNGPKIKVGENAKPVTYQDEHDLKRKKNINRNLFAAMNLSSSIRSSFSRIVSL